MRPTIAILYVGGSIGMVANKRTGRIEPIESLGEIHRALPDVQREVKLEFHSIANVGSSEVTPEHWIELTNKIEQLYANVDGFVIIHGTNTMSYTAAALSFALQNLSKPVVLTGALIPINDIASDGRMNLVFAIRAAQLDIAEVCIVLGSRVLRGNRAKKVEQSFLQTFDSPLFPPLAEFNLDVYLHPWRTVRRKRRPNFRSTFDTNVTSITLHPGMPITYLESILDSYPHGIVIRAYGLGMLPEELFPWLRRAKEEGIAIVVTSQMTRGRIDLHHFRKQLTLEKLGVISGKNMTYEAAVTKLMWVLGQTHNHRRVRELMERNLVGELDD
ncbi:asparaginase [Candidatus Peregrinibacteria bacterium]|nr:asparaginase [Candidatus Peregrinibacteria bacterium]